MTKKEALRIVIAEAEAHLYNIDDNDSEYDDVRKAIKVLTS